MKTLYIMIGAPCVGKTTFSKGLILGQDNVVVSHDTAVIEAVKSIGMTYKDFFKAQGVVRKQLNKKKNEIFKDMLKRANESENDVFVDMTMMTKKGREYIKSQIPNRDSVYYIVFETEKEDLDFLNEQSKKRDEELPINEKKGIHKGILTIMQNNYQRPEEDEADNIRFIDLWWKNKKEESHV